jgi:phosphatidylserine decarboxylase
VRSILPLSVPTDLRYHHPHLLSYQSFVNVSVLSTRFQTPVCRRTLSPVFTAKDATFDFPIYLSLSEKLGVLEFVVWDKDMLRKEYLGEYALPLDEWFRGNVFAYDDLDNQVRLIILKSLRRNTKSFHFFSTQPFSVNLISSRATTNATGTMHIKVGFVHPPNLTIQPDFAETYNALIKRSRPSLVSAVPVRIVSTSIRASCNARYVPYITDTRYRYNPLPSARTRVRR